MKLVIDKPRSGPDIRATVSWGAIRRIKDPGTLNGGSNAVLNWFAEEWADSFDNAIDGLKPTKKHVTVFVQRIIGASGFAFPNWLAASRYSGRGFAFISTESSGWWTVAHEWGHTFGMAHQHAYGLLPFGFNIMSYAGGSGLTPVQVSEARHVASMYR